MLNQLLSDKNKKPLKKLRINDVCDNILSGLDKEIDSNKKSFSPPPSTINETPKTLPKGEKILLQIQAKKKKSSVFMTTQDHKTSKRIEKMFSAGKSQKKPNLQQVEMKIIFFFDCLKIKRKSLKTKCRSI